MNNLKLTNKDMVNFSKEELISKLNFLKKELFNLRFQKALGDLKNTSGFLLVKKSIARINTELTKRLKLENN